MLGMYCMCGVVNGPIDHEAAICRFGSRAFLSLGDYEQSAYNMGTLHFSHPFLKPYNSSLKAKGLLTLNNTVTARAHGYPKSSQYQTKSILDTPTAQFPPDPPSHIHKIPLFPNKPPILCFPFSLSFSFFSFSFILIFCAPPTNHKLATLIPHRQTKARSTQRNATNTTHLSQKP